VRPALVTRARLLGVAAACLALIASALPAAAASGRSSGPLTLSVNATRAGRSAPSAWGGGSAVTIRRDAFGRTHFVGAAAGQVLARSTDRRRTPAAAALASMSGYAADFGIASPSRDLRTMSVESPTKGLSVVRFQQVAAGLPVFGGELVNLLDGANNLLSVTGETSMAVQSSTYSVSPAAARAAALKVTGTDHGLRPAALTATAPQQWLYDPSLFDESAPAGARAVWRVEVTARDDLDVRELVLVDGLTGRVVLNKDEIEHENRVVCDNGEKRNNVYKCTKAHYKRTETGPPSTPRSDVNYAFNNAGYASDFYASLGLDLTALIGSDFGDGQKLRSTVRVCPTGGSCPYNNAFWDGAQMVYGQGFARADDVVGHELTHGVTQHTSGLVYWDQSGAINESMSDVFGEFIDLTDHVGDDGATVRWELGEDLLPAGTKVARDMQTPARFHQPDRVGGHYWTTTTSDDGGVHTNSGVGNKAAYLITDGTANEPGQVFNGQSIVGLGIDKATWVYWLAQLAMTPGSDYSDLADALASACTALEGATTAPVVTTADDCANVDKATLATQMRLRTGPGAPQSVHITGEYHAIRVRWATPLTHGTAAINSYVLIVSPSIQGQNFLPIADADVRDVTIGGIPAGKTFKFGLMAVSSDGNGPVVPLTLRGTKLKLKTARTVPYKKHNHFTGRLTYSNGDALAGRTVTLYRKVAGKSSYKAGRSTTTTSTGVYSFDPKQKHDATYFVNFASNSSGVMGSRSTTHGVKVAHRVSFHADDVSVKVGHAVHFKGRVQPVAHGSVTLQRRAVHGGSSWKVFTSAALSSGGHYHLTMTPTTRRDFEWRVVIKKSDGLARGVSRVRVVVVT
jgi:bacillolysin